MGSTFSKALTYSVTLHVTLLLILLFGDFSAAPPKPTPSATQVKPIQAVVVDRKKIDDQVNKLKKQKADEAKRLKAIEEQAAAAKRRRAKEEQRLKTLEQQRKKKERERKAADAAAAKARAKAVAAEKLRKQKEREKQAAEKAAAEAKAKRLKEQKAAEKAEKLRKKKAAEKKRKEREARERAEQQRLLEQQLAEEMASRQQARNQQITSEIGKYTALITRVIQSKLLTDKATMEGKSCNLTIKLAPSGFVISVQAGKGDRVVCDAARNAVNKAGTLPVSKDPEVFEKMRTISLTVVPEF
ncbi:protein TolA [Thalassotalea insulae]|uniref:Protein TolA n=1 Tax=Thalassotalea insulae TaxID=2056778 RepID=A0ABQ6GML9_9GAMM|nr:cell envelope integrity protein TolA [Thalassotalea insulae]GLX77238.1 protein TolA [Thalassotalea insulae]